jgi:DNA helicase II / ATP-dependent DNA helicase PcrA
MITLLRFYRAVAAIGVLPDRQQRLAIGQALGEPLFIVAGPGTGKTTCLTYRILKLIFVDGVPPEGIVATTFTRKAAAELRSRLLGRGFALMEALAIDPHLTAGQRAAIAAVDVNHVWTGTVDSLCEEVLRHHRRAGEQPPLLIDDFVAKTLLLRAGLFNGSRHTDAALDNFLLSIYSPTANRWGYHIGTKTQLLQNLWERQFHDQANIATFAAGGPPAERAGRRQVQAALDDFAAELRGRGMVDFAILEQEVLNRLRGGALTRFISGLRVVLVDEYQDTNLLQEQLYLEMAAACAGALTVVGDDDQSMYRFRGATVELFSDFSARYSRRFGRTPALVFLRDNYRSTRGIVSFVNSYATLDASYQSVRVASKPPLRPGPAALPGLPVLGMFRATLADLARDLAQFVFAVCRGSGWVLPDGSVVAVHAANGGDVGDCALLCSSPAEHGNGGNSRLPLLLKQELAALSPLIRVFNPRGEDMATIDSVGIFGGLLLECLDPGGVIQGRTRGLPPDALTAFTQWRRQTLVHVSDPAQADLLDYAQHWARRDPGNPLLIWRPSVSILELIYGLRYFFRGYYDDPEGQVYLEVFTRQLSASQQIGAFKGRLVHDPAKAGLEEASIAELLRGFLAPVAAGVVGVDEDLIGSFPRDQLSILSVHQAKGLEFPLTIIDVGSDFSSNHASQRFKRFPDRGGVPHRLEDLVRPYSPPGLLGAPGRGDRDRAFDDLYRQFFVAFSRPRDVLLLVGVDPTAPTGSVPNVATGWDRTGVPRWSPAVPYMAI